MVLVDEGRNHARTNLSKARDGFPTSFSSEIVAVDLVYSGAGSVEGLY